MWYTYIHYKATDLKPFYVGKGKRWRSGSKAGRSGRWNNIVKKHGLEVEKMCFFDVESDAFEHEKFLIKTLRDMGFDLCNMTDGGEGVSGFPAPNKGVPVPEYRKEMQRLAMTGRKASEETKKKISVAHQGRKKPDEWRGKISESNKSVRGVPVRNEMTGESFASIGDAAMWVIERGLSVAHYNSVVGRISVCTLGHRRLAFGHKWVRL